MRKYGEIIQEQLNRGFIERVDENDNQKQTKLHYIPHHPVKKESSTTPIRIVYDCSCRQTSSTASLNDCLEDVPPQLNAIPEQYKRVLRNERDELDTRNERKIGINNDNFLIDSNKKVIFPNNLKLKEIQYVLNKRTTAKCEEKWQTYFTSEINFSFVWQNIYNALVPNKVKEFQWKCVHNIIYTESKLQSMRLSNGRCHFCTDNIENLNHLFFHCPSVKHLIGFAQETINSIEPGNQYYN